ncbi:hypothetical protein [Vibrio tapetis]|uniref:Uncharacterized protein n=1 Tax=Vibrio tapetis subsp. tapetis TaxID=1671868 RepID=A0A2N8ZMV3_9VIBR|nr:hypothetical protein [Vibrio tapetis]SON53207.1 conserved exported protein of unknown function [Vibrio tapetis subsp. tapetis]
MIKYIMIALVGLGVYVGVTYSDDIKDVINSDQVENAQEHIDTLKDAASNMTEAAGDIADKVSETLN